MSHDPTWSSWEVVADVQKEGWLPISSALFKMPYHGPQEVVTRDFYDRMLAPWGVDINGHRVTAGVLDDTANGWRLNVAKIDWENERFEYQWVSTPPRRHSVGGWSGSPWLLWENPGSARLVCCGDPAELVKRAESAWITILADLNELVAAGDAKIAARIRTPLAESFHHIPKDVWAHFEPELWRTGVWREPRSGERLYSVHAQFSPGAIRGLFNSRMELTKQLFHDEIARRAAEGNPIKRKDALEWVANRGISKEIREEWWREISDDQKFPKGRPRSKSAGSH